MDKKHLIDLANARMPFGKYSNWRLIDVPEHYFIWFARKGFPKGRLGALMKEILELKEGGLENMLKPLKDNTK
ncbi:MAG TPA: hypothetical protein DEE98_07320 [Elusimicrobia bacterium]|nr:MAG: hypothetical protein A2278_00045 [Elusimicrobia bacterium RIFOXYA12_FULL_49_49]OGS09126.1 MAG: hypothetical protein A2204_02135 [Elusimicrobia bacterium RIFOXYA1_FULL_47_7]OGS15870.1 MAG: hypothetical protein A2251_04180 [Elusimicrobia bacterium RIFOXYA2_FULL_47_53]OGS27163.1 MAG: hypothetical protein A2339_00430 [Elusimicrobia bacterium RIFOXYB12_FULL_50_12]OGS31203.1 MAG: hypothetical protein A2323_08900 [Elusimicrobia bacterium RIFOXYB2_FULL_46_23]HBU70174.1 hypothetical protein [El